MKKVLAILVALMIMASALPMMASAEGEAQTLKVMLGGGTPLSIDPHLNSASGGGNILKCAFTGLLSYQPPVDGAESVLGPDLAESMPTISEDLLTYTFTLREGLKWSDGEDFVASQMVSSWERSASEELGADYGFLFDVIARNAEGKLDLAADDAARTFTVKLKAYTPYFLDLCAFYPFVPIRVELADNEGIWATKPESYVGMGPFKMTKYAVDDEISFVKNDNYWNKDAIKLDGINFYLSEDNVAVLTAYENNTVQFIDTIDPTEYERIKTSYPGELNFSRQVGTWYILINAYKDVSPAGK